MVPSYLRTDSSILCALFLSFLVTVLNSVYTLASSSLNSIETALLVVNSGFVRVTGRIRSVSSVILCSSIICFSIALSIFLPTTCGTTFRVSSSILKVAFAGSLISWVYVSSTSKGVGFVTTTSGLATPPWLLFNILIMRALAFSLLTLSPCLPDLITTRSLVISRAPSLTSWNASLQNVFT